MVVCYAPTHALRSVCDTTLLKVALSKKTIGQSNFAVTGPRMWNNVPKYVRSAGTLMALRKKTSYTPSSLALPALIQNKCSHISDITFYFTVLITNFIA